MSPTTPSIAPVDGALVAEPKRRPRRSPRDEPRAEPSLVPKALPEAAHASLPEVSLEVHDVADLARIYEPDVVAVVLRRSSPFGPERYDELASRDFAFSLRGAPEALDLGLLFADAQEPSSAAFAATVRDDIASVVDMFACLLDAREVGLRIACTSRATCPEYHYDRVAIRLVSTLLGPGTEWRVSSPVGPEATYAARASDLVLLKGSAFPGRRSGVFHRSPPVSGRRLFYSLDALA
jgi:hypothetical protein